MIDWIDDAGRTWGACKRRILLGGYWYGNEQFHRDGFSPRSMVAKLWEERDGAAQGAAKQKVLEVFTGEALEFEVAIHGAPEHWFYLAHYRYVVPNRWMGSKAKLAELRQLFPRRFAARDDYYDELHGLHCFLLGRWPAFHEEQTVATVSQHDSQCVADRIKV